MNRRVKLNSFFAALLLLWWASLSWAGMIVNLDSFCESISHLKMPSQDEPQETDIEQLLDCNAADLYYGINNTIRDYDKARYCALLNKNFTILSLLYANGLGVQRNFNLALHFACLRSVSDSVKSNFINGLVRYQKKRNYENDFDGCYEEEYEGMVICLAYEQARIKIDMSHHAKNIQKYFPSNALKQVQIVDTRYNNYVRKRVYELFYEEKINVSLMIKEKITQDVNYLNLLEQTQACTLPEYTENDYRIADAKLNQVYQQSRNKKFLSIIKNYYQHSVLDHILNTQRAWIQYKEAMTHLGELQCPKKNKYSWSTFLTEQRIKQLEALPVYFKELARELEGEHA